MDSVLIAEKCRRVLAAKLDTSRPITERQGDSNAAEALHRQVISKALTAVKNDAPEFLWCARAAGGTGFRGFDPVRWNQQAHSIHLGSKAEVNGAALTKEAFESRA